MSDRIQIHRVRIGKVALKRPHRVSDHAFARYLQRVNGVNVYAEMISAARRVLEGSAVAMAIAQGRDHIVIGRAKLVIENGVVVTVLDPKMRTKEESGSRLAEGLREMQRRNGLGAPA